MTDRTVRADCGGISMGWNCPVTAHMPMGSDDGRCSLLHPEVCHDCPRVPEERQECISVCVCVSGGGGEEETEGFIWQGVKKKWPAFFCWFFVMEEAGISSETSVVPASH